jgi:hypothetical protein
MALAGTGRLIQGLLGTRIGKAMLAPATKEAAKASVPGAVLSGAFTAIGGGGIPATLATAGLDVGLSTAGARLAGKVTPESILRLTGQGPKRQAVANFIAGAKPGDMSTLQNIAMGVGSVSASMAALPLYPSQQLVGLDPAQLQQLIAEPVVMDQTATTEQQLLQRDLINRSARRSIVPWNHVPIARCGIQPWQGVLSGSTH